MSPEGTIVPGELRDAENVEVLRSHGSNFSSFVIIDLIDFESMLLV